VPGGNGERLESLRSASGVVAEVMDRLETVKETARSLAECPGTCRNGKLEFSCEGKPFWWPCPLMTKDCEYGKKLYRQFVEQIRLAIVGLDIPRVHVGNFSEPRSTTAMKAASQWNGAGFLVLIGPTDTGKSFAAAWAVKRFAERAIDRDAWRRPDKWHESVARIQGSVRWVHIQELIEAREDRERILKARFLVIDDLASEDATPRTKSVINYAISTRYDDRLPTVITANLTRRELEERYGGRIMDRLINSGIIVDCDGPGFRAEMG